VTDLCYTLDMSRLEEPRFLDDGMHLMLTLAENQYPYTQLDSVSWQLTELEGCKQIKLKPAPEAYYFT